MSFLADIAAGFESVPYDAAFYEAQSLVLQHGTSRRIDDDNAVRLCERMRTWALSYTAVSAPAEAGRGPVA